MDLETLKDDIMREEGHLVLEPYQDHLGFWTIGCGHLIRDNERDELMKAVFIVESAIKIYYKPDKINLASLGNLTPHVHWHVIPRFYDDNHFPGSIWSEQKKFKKTKISNQVRKKINSFIIKNLN